MKGEEDDVVLYYFLPPPGEGCPGQEGGCPGETSYGKIDTMSYFSSRLKMMKGLPVEKPT